jgi:hypothetical protein
MMIEYPVIILLLPGSFIGYEWLKLKDKGGSPRRWSEKIGIA